MSTLTEGPEGHEIYREGVRAGADGVVEGASREFAREVVAQEKLYREFEAGDGDVVEALGCGGEGCGPVADGPEVGVRYESLELARMLGAMTADSGP